MNIPSKVKIGDIEYGVEITENINLGVNYTAEIDYMAQKIRIRDRNVPRIEADLLHEIVHGILDFLGYEEHDEKKVEELARCFHMIIVDNPFLFNNTLPFGISDEMMEQQLKSKDVK